MSYMNFDSKYFGIDPPHMSYTMFARLAKIYHSHIAYMKFVPLDFDIGRRHTANMNYSLLH